MSGSPDPFSSEIAPPGDECAARIDPAIVAALFVKHADELRRFLTGVLRNHEQASDVMQLAFAKTLEQGHTAQAASLKSWLFRVAYHEAMTLKRRQAVESRAANELAARGQREQRNPAMQVVDRETVERVRAAMDRLPSEQRQVVRLRMHEQKKFATIAEELDLPLGTVLTRMQLALRKLRKLLESDE
ncbi:MAG TPA: RNA polymerase sigma factor [Pirellulales bacterium]